ncbi:MAG TPA: hypothetical protein VFF98_17215 [Novosphingobium sp.]|nr:hypothetical protein [Novosphingobium sp.]
MISLRKLRKVIDEHAAAASVPVSPAWLRQVERELSAARQHGQRPAVNARGA